MRRAIATAVLVSALVLGAAAVGLATHWKAPADAKKLANPVKPSPQSVARGKQLFAFNCAKCHGLSGLGDGPSVGSLRNQGGVNLRILATETDGELFWKISNGKGDMPPWELVLKAEDRWHLVNYIRTLEKKP